MRTHRLRADARAQLPMIRTMASQRDIAIECKGRIFDPAQSQDGPTRFLMVDKGAGTPLKLPW
jgi:hypothetical protein